MSLPTAAEQQMLQLINRLRANPADEFNNLILSSNPPAGATPDITAALTFFGVDLSLFQQQLAAYPKAAPLAWNTTLDSTAAAHSALMIVDNTQSHQLPGEADLGTRVAAAGYGYSFLGENIYAYGSSVLQADAGFIVDWGSGPGGMQSQAGHRQNLLSSGFTEIGIDISSASGSTPNVGPLVITEDLGSTFTYAPQIVGVAFHDLNANNFYDPGEGDAGVTITAVGSPGTFTTTTWASGGYELTVPRGSYTVTFSGGGLPASKTVQTTIGTANVEVDDNDVIGGGGIATLAIAGVDATDLQSAFASKPFTFMVTRGGDTTVPVSVQWAVTPSGTSPADASDFDTGTLPSGTLTFAAGQTSQTIAVNIAADPATDATETFAVTLSGATAGAGITAASAIGTILNNNSPSLDAVLTTAYRAILRTAPAPSDAGVSAAQIDVGTMTLGAFEASLISGGQIIYSTFPALVTIDAFYNATPSSVTLDNVAAGSAPLSATYLHTLGYSDPNVWSILGSWWADDANSTFNAQYGGLSDSAFIQKAYQNLFGFAPTPANAANLLADMPGLRALLHSDTAGVHGGLYGYLLYVGQTYDIGRYAAAANAFVRAAANGTVQYGPELTVRFPPAGMTSAMAAADASVITVTQPDQLLDPGGGGHTIRFLAGSGNDTIDGFDLGTDGLNLRALLSGTPRTNNTAPDRYVTLIGQGNDAVPRFDPAGHGGGVFAVLTGLGHTLDLDAFVARRVVLPG